jgi:hypothetical protein
LPFADRCCEPCEDDFRSQLAAIRLRRWWWAGFACVWPAFLILTGPVQASWRGRVWVWGAFSASIAIVEALLMTLVAGVLVASAFVHLRVHVERRSFLGD